MQRLNKVLAEATLSTSCARVSIRLLPSGSERVGVSAGATFAISKLAMTVSIDLVISMPMPVSSETSLTEKLFRWSRLEINDSLAGGVLIRLTAS